MLKRDYITDPCNDFIPKHSSRTFIRSLNQGGNPLSSISSILRQLLNFSKTTPIAADKNNNKQSSISDIDRDVLKSTQFYKAYHRELGILGIRRFVVFGLSLLPVLLYRRIPILRENSDWRIRGFVSVMLLYFPNAYHQKHLTKNLNKINDKYYQTYGQRYRKYILTSDPKYLQS